MNRRDFVKGLSGALLVVAAAGSVPVLRAAEQSRRWRTGVQATVLDRMLKGSPRGLILESLDKGKTWQQRANFGPHCAVLDLFEHRGQIHAQVGVAGHTFVLASRDVRTWRTT